MEREAFENECKRRFKMSSNQYIELLSIKDIRDILVSLFESQSEINRLNNKIESIEAHYSDMLFQCETMKDREINRLKEENERLTHYEATTLGLWATDRPDLIDDPKKVMFRLSQNKH